jgi:hypothetical protein
MPSSFVVRATDKDGNRLIMVINPDSVNVTYLSNETVAANLVAETSLITPPRIHSRACAKSAAKKPS